MRVIAIFAAVTMAAVKGPFEEALGSDTSCYNEEDKGLSYRGLETQTKSGRTCQNWGAKRPHRIEMEGVDLEAGGIGDHNYCRNPTEGADFEKPWCYTMDSALDKEECNIKACPEDNEVADLGDKRLKLKTAMNWHDCECASQLFGSTETTEDTSVAGDFLQKNAVGKRGSTRGRMVNGKCQCPRA
mmetsp:Transcript_29675/g.65237  ORF Transcript_29675/g.65237 Transcript_29675/m.65237 type:complete len:186 (+) Transcript_29675:55-612(+)